MYAVKGNSFRAIGSAEDLQEGETSSLVPPPTQTRESDVWETKLRISQWLDEVVQARGYDNIVSCASYANSTIDQFKAEALVAIAWRDAVYAMGYEILAETPEGVSGPDDVMALLPQPQAFGWPA